MTEKDGSSPKVRLGFFSLGVVCPLYFFMQYYFTPICWWFTENTDMFGLLKDVFIFFDIKGMEIFSRQSLIYGGAGITAFLAGYFLLPKDKARINFSLMQKTWSLPRAECLFWIFFLMGFAWKSIKILSGLDITSIYNPVNMFSSPYLAFFLSMNWFNTLALGIINVAYQESKAKAHPGATRLRKLAIATSVFTIGASLTSGSETATAFPVFIVLVIRQAYSPIPFMKIAMRMGVGVCLLFIVKSMVDVYNQGEDAVTGEGSPMLFGLLFVLTYRVNMSHVLEATINYGRQYYPNGTISQFWVDMLPYGAQRVNVFDGNEFGRAIGVAAEEDFMTGVAVTNMGDLFLNWGLAGIVIGMLLHGIFYKALTASCTGRHPSHILVYAMLFPILLHGIESPVSVLYSTTIKMISMCLFIIFVLTAGARKGGISGQLPAP